MEGTLDGGQLLEGLFFLGGDQRGGGDEAGDGGSAERDPRVFLGPFGGGDALAEARLHLLPGVGEGELGRLGLLSEEFRLAQLSRRRFRVEWLRLGRCARIARAAGVVGVHIWLPSWS